MAMFLHPLEKKHGHPLKNSLESRNQRLARVQEFKTIFTRVALRFEIKMVRRTVQSPRCRVYVVWGKQNSLA